MARISSSPGLSAPFNSVFPTPVISTRIPTASDTKYPLGQIWVDKTTAAVYSLALVSAGSATWVALGGGSSAVDSMDGDTGSATPVGGAITVAGGSNLTSSATGSTVTVALDSAPSVTGDITTTGGNVIISGAAKQLQVEGGAVTDFIGQATLSAGVATVLNTNIATGDRIFLTRSDANSSSALGLLSVTALTASTSFVITALDPSDGSTAVAGDISIVDYFIVRSL